MRGRMIIRESNEDTDKLTLIYEKIIGIEYNISRIYQEIRTPWYVKFIRIFKKNSYI